MVLGHVLSCDEGGHHENAGERHRPRIRPAMILGRLPYVDAARRQEESSEHC